MISAEDIMSEHVVVIYDDMLIRQVAHLLLRDRVNGFPVVNKEIGVVGIVTLTDLFRIIQDVFHEYPKALDFDQHIEHFKDITVSEIMTREVLSITPETSIEEIIHLVVDRNIHVFPVMREKKLIGIVGRHDILNAIFSFE